MNKPVHKPLETNRHLNDLSAKALGNPVYYGTAHKGFTYCKAAVPFRTVPAQVINGNTEVVVGIHEAAAGGDNTMTVKVSIVSKGNVIAVLK